MVGKIIMIMVTSLISIQFKQVFSLDLLIISLFLVLKLLLKQEPVKNLEML